MSKGKITLLPTPIGPLSVLEMLNDNYVDILKNCRFIVAENARTARRFISSLQLGLAIPELEIFEMSEPLDKPALEAFLRQSIAKGDIVVMSEAGLPAVADPGSLVVQWAHKNDITVNPVSGPGSIYLALMASGFNGQAFTFHGYCPIKEDALKKFISDCEKIAASGYTQIFIETPYRSDRVLGQLLRDLREETMLCIACGLHSDTGFVRTKTIAQWRQQIPVLGKQPAVFLIGRN